MKATDVQETQTKTAALLAALRWDRHFLIAVGILAAMAGTVLALGWVVKYPVPWPAHVKVDEDFRMRSLPNRLGPYVKVTNGGDTRFPRSTMRALRLGTSYDKARYPSGRSNWYVARVYENTRAANSPYRYWHLEVYYYTGLRDQVPHVPLRCLQAAGARVLNNEKITFHVPEAPEPWQGRVDFQRAHWEKNVRGQHGQGAEYYVFSFNGKPERRWEVVRLKMGLPFSSYNYFAKIQFAPLISGNAAPQVVSVSEIDRAAGDFVKHALPSILRTLPTAADVEALSRAEEQDNN